MARIERPSDDVLCIHLSDYHSLDIVRLPATKKYRIVFAERYGVQRRAFIDINYEDANTISRFLASVFNPGQERPSADEIELPELPPPPVMPRTKTKL